ncbi:MAG: hypothetical protein HFG60_02875 [Lachnospiraceae bacterium]|nr:hypothetical protein [Lachnospiraceae bacterium]MCI9183696.1 hypothetical protein [Lachnospiraceae bacterium]
MKKIKRKVKEVNFVRMNMHNSKKKRIISSIIVILLVAAMIVPMVASAITAFH